MSSGHGARAARAVSGVRVLAIVPALLFGLGILADPASAVIGRAKDTITGDPTTVLSWSEGVWSQSHNPIPGCLTFPGGHDTGPGDPTAVDSVDCNTVQDGWSWSVVVPGPFTLYYSFYGIPPGFVVCGQVFGLTEVSGVDAQVYLDRDYMMCRDVETEDVLWEGTFSKFRPEFLGGNFIGATRCGRIRVIAQGACCYPDGHCEFVEQARCPTEDWREEVPCEPNPCPQPLGACCYPDGACVFVEQALCPTGDWREGVPCEPNPCPPPVPVKEIRWGQIKAHYR